MPPPLPIEHQFTTTTDGFVSSIGSFTAFVSAARVALAEYGEVPASRQLDGGNTGLERSYRIASQKEIDDFIKEVHICVLSTTGPGYRPHSTPMWYLYEDGVFIFSTSPGTQKCMNVERNGQATVVVDRREEPYYALMAQGDAEIGPSLSEEEEWNLAARYLGDEGAKKYIAERGHFTNEVSIRVRPRKYMEYYAAVVGANALKAHLSPLMTKEILTSRVSSMRTTP